MKKLFRIFLLAACLISCSHKDKTQANPPTDVVVVTPSALPTAPPAPKAPYIGSSWSLVVPDGFERGEAKDPSVEGFFINQNKKSLITVVKEQWAGSSQDYAFLGTIALKHAGIATTDPVQLTLNGETVTLIEGNADPEDIHAWVWMTVKNGYGYTLSCGGNGDPSQYRELCTGLFESFKIN
jgi:hypothetical protein